MVDGGRARALVTVSTGATPGTHLHTSLARGGANRAEARAFRATISAHNRNPTPNGNILFECLAIAW